MSDMKDYEFHDMKAGKFYCQEVKVLKLSPERLASFFDAQMKQFPKVFANLNVALNFREISFESDLKALSALKAYSEVITERGHKVVGVMGFKPSLVKGLGLQPLSEAKEKTASLISGDASSMEPEETLAKVEPPVIKEQCVAEPVYENKIHRGAVRGGMVIVSEGDLVVIGNVAYGAEIVAKGSVIVWGRLEGRVHAGTSDNATLNANSYVISTYFNPELISINGIYATNAGIDEGLNKDNLHKTTLVKTDKDNSKLEFFEG